MHTAFHDNPNKAFEIGLTGAIGTGKSTVAAVMMTYMIYKTLCLKDPRSFYKLTGNSPIVFIVMNLTLDLAYTGLYSLIVENIKQSPWFCERVTIRGKYDFTIEFGKGISLMAGSNVQHSIGKNVIGAVLDEVNFSKAPKGSKNSVMDLYRNIRRRMESRFMKQGIMPGFLIMVSSKNSELDFLEQYLNSVRHSNKILIVDEPVYKIKPPETYLGPTFKVAVGDKTKDSFIIKDDHDESRATDYNYRVIEVPIEYRPAFEGDINESLREIAGITVFNSNKLIPYPKRILQCVDETRRSPFFQETIFLDLNTEDEVIDYLDGIKSLRSLDPTRPRFIHVDIGLKGDCLGLSVVHVSKKTLVSRVNEEGTTINVQENVYYQDLSLRVAANQGSEIPLYKIREFIIWMRKNLWKIAKVTYDGFQSADSIQLLRTAGFDTGLLSVDRTDVPYLTLRSAILDNRVQLYHHDTLLRELEELEYDRAHRKVDHPIISIDNRPGSKDVADSLCLHEDTRLFLLSGRSLTIGELYSRGWEDEWILSCDVETNSIKPVKVGSVIKKNKIPEKLYKISLDNGESFSVTGDHLILCRDGSYKRAKDLRVDDSLMPFTTYTESLHNDTYRRIRNPFTGKVSWVYRLVVDTLMREDYDNVDLSDGSPYRVIHHVDHDKFNDRPSNLRPMSLREHRKLHGDIFRAYNRSPEKRKKTSELCLSGKSGFSAVDPERMRAVRSKNGHDTMIRYNGSQRHRDCIKAAIERGSYDKVRERFAENTHTPEANQRRSMTRAMTGVSSRDSIRMCSYNKDPDIKEKQWISKVRKVYELVQCNSNLFDKESVTLTEYLGVVNNLKEKGILGKHYGAREDYDSLIKAGVPLTNHRVVSIVVIDNDRPVYDLSLPEIHNFGISAGVFVHNCGAIYNAQEYYSVKDPMKNLVRKDTLKTQMNVLAQLKESRPRSLEEEMQRVDWL